MGVTAPDVPGDKGGFSRFFSIDAWAERNLPFLMVSKASKKEKDAGCAALPVKEIDIRSDSAKGAMKDKELQSGKNTHPTVKPLKLMAYLITMGSREGDIVLDPFAGSGSTCVAAKLLNRRFIGIEIDPDYHQIATKRVERAEDLRRVMTPTPQPAKADGYDAEVTGEGVGEDQVEDFASININENRVALKKAA
jgi:DNA modification methylase